MGKIFWVNSMKRKQIISVIATILCCMLLFSGISYAFLINKGETESTEKGKSNIPYYPETESRGILFTLPDESIMLLFLDFQNDCTRIIFPDNIKDKKLLLGRFSADYNIQIDYPVLEEIVDRVCGIIISKNNTSYRYTGVQICELLKENNNDYSLKREIAEKTIEQISKNGFSKSDFLYIIENSNTDLTYTDCYNWDLYIKQTCKNVEVRK